jgi:hypothetical protein
MESLTTILSVYNVPKGNFAIGKTSSLYTFEAKDPITAPSEYSVA